MIDKINTIWVYRAGMLSLLVLSLLRQEYATAVWTVFCAILLEVIERLKTRKA